MFFTQQLSRWTFQLLLSVCFAVLLLFDNPVSAKQENATINLGYCVLDGFVEEGSTGVGYELMNVVIDRLRDQGHQVNVSFVPAMRLLNGYRKKQFDVIYPIMKIKNFTLKSFQKWGFDHVPLYSRPLYEGGQFVIYSHIGSEPIDDLQGLLTKSTVVIAGAYIPVDLVPPTPYKVEQVEAAQQAFKMVEFGRVDAFLVHKGWGEHVLSGMDIDELQHGEPFETIRGGFIAQHNELGERVITYIDQIIADMIEDGTYAKILKNYPDDNLAIKHHSH